MLQLDVLLLSSILNKRYLYCVTVVRDRKQSMAGFTICAHPEVKKASSGKLRHVALVRTDVSEELNASFIRGARVGELESTLAVTSNRRTLEALSSSESSVLTRATRRHIPEAVILHSHRLETLKSYICINNIQGVIFVLNIISCGLTRNC
jgi:hypothetical protein